VKTLLERAKGSALDVRTFLVECPQKLGLLLPRTRQFRTLDLTYNCWPDFEMFSEAIPGPFPLLRTLEIRVLYLDLGPGALFPSSLPLFSSAVNLKKFILRSAEIQHLNRFAFPNLTTFELSATHGSLGLPVSPLLDFLEGSPTLRTVRIKIAAEIHTEDVPPERVVVLPNVEMFSVTQDGPGYRIAAHMKCPSARLVSLIYEHEAEDEMPEVFPTWDAVDPQYMASTIDGMVLRITSARCDTLSCSLSLLSPDLATLGLGYIMIAGSEDHRETPDSLGEKHYQVF
jgi:hypothetical protein